jgi:hypothetical protein
MMSTDGSGEGEDGGEGKAHRGFVKEQSFLGLARGLYIPWIGRLMALPNNEHELEDEVDRRRREQSERVPRASCIFLLSSRHTLLRA